MLKLTSSLVQLQNQESDSDVKRKVNRTVGKTKITDDLCDDCSIMQQDVRVISLSDTLVRMICGRFVLFFV